jgi:adenylosuccinate lyase
MLTRTNELLNGVVIFADRMKHNLGRTRGLIYSQRVLLALIEMGMNRQDAYGTVQEAARQSWDFGRPFRDALIEQPAVRERLSEALLDTLMDVDYYLRHVPDIFARAGVPLELPIPTH